VLSGACFSHRRVIAGRRRGTCSIPCFSAGTRRCWQADDEKRRWPTAQVSGMFRRSARSAEQRRSETEGLPLRVQSREPSSQVSGHVSGGCILQPPMNPPCFIGRIPMLSPRYASANRRDLPPPRGIPPEGRSPRALASCRRHRRCHCGSRHRPETARPRWCVGRRQLGTAGQSSCRGRPAAPT
jgi:hypothetical protein